MADFAAVLKKTLGNMGETTPEIRQKVYEKARDTVKRQIEAMEKTPPQAAIDRQFQKLEDAITTVEAEFVPAVDELNIDDVLDELVADTPKPKTAEPEAGTTEVSATKENDIDLAGPEPETEIETVAIETPSAVDDGSELENAAAEPNTDKIAEIKARARANAAELEAKSADATDAVEAAVDDVNGDIVPEAAMPEADIDPLESFLNEQVSASEEPVVSVDTAVDDLKVAAEKLSDDVLGEITPSGDRVAEIVTDAGSSVDDVVAGAADAVPMQETRVRSGGLLKTLLALIVVGGGGYFAYANQDMLRDRWSNQVVPWWQSLTGGGGETSANDGDVPVRTVTTTTVSEDENGEGATTDEAAADEVAPDSAEDDVTDISGGEPTVKFTQRLTEEGTEIDDGPAAGAQEQAGEGSSVAPQTPGTATSEAPIEDTGEVDVAETETGETPLATPEQPTATPVGQRAIFYEERTGSQQGTALAGSTIWSVVNESPGGSLPVEPAIRALSNIPELGIEMEMTIRRNGDSTFPASHIIELFFRVPDTFEGRAIADVQRVTFKTSEQDPGNALIAVPAPLDQNIFLIALTDAVTAVDTNVQLMKRENWIDIPMEYVSGRRALITFEKGIPGERVFNEVFSAWEAAPLN